MESEDGERSTLMSQSCVGQTGMEVTCRSRRRPTVEELTKSGYKWEEMRREKSYILNETIKLSP